MTQEQYLCPEDHSGLQSQNDWGNNFCIYQWTLGYVSLGYVSLDSGYFYLLETLQVEVLKN